MKRSIKTTPRNTKPIASEITINPSKATTAGKMLYLRSSFKPIFLKPIFQVEEIR